MRNSYKILVAKREGKQPLGRIKHNWENNIRMDHSGIGRECVDRIHLIQDRDRWLSLVNMVMSLRVFWNAGNFLIS